MMNDNARLLIVGSTALVIGLCVGVSAGVLLAPYSGARTRRQLRSFAEDMVEDGAEAVDKVIQRGKTGVP
jgi:gas vesicle protein